MITCQCPGRLSGLSPAKHETNELFSMHTRKIYNVNEAMKHDWWKSLQQHNQQYHILFLVTFPYLVTSLWEHDLIIEASPICNNLPVIVILKVSFLD